MAPPSADRPVTSQLAPWMLGQVRALGGEVAPLLRTFQLPEDAEHRPEVTLPLTRFRALGDACAVAAGVPDFGLHCAQALPRGAYGLLEFTARASSHLAGALERLVRYHRLLNEVITITFDERGPGPALHHGVRGEPEAMGAQANVFTVAAFVKLCRELSGDPAWAPRRAWVAHPADATLPALERFLGTAVTANAGENGFAFDRAFLRRPLPSADPALARVLDQQAEVAAAARGGAGGVGFAAQVEAAFERTLHRGTPSLVDVAVELGMSARTLQRRLAAQGSSFQQVVDAVGERLARAWVTAGELPLGEIAYRLGYSELRAFVRAYKRWTGRTPGADRAAART